MRNGKLISSQSSAVQTNNFTEKKKYSRTGYFGTTAITAIFLGTSLLHGSLNNNTLTGYDFERFSCTNYINLNHEKESVGTISIVVDLLKSKNLNKIEKMALFDTDWNGTGGSRFSDNSISLFRSIVEMLDKQPQIAPTGRNSLLMQYELSDKSLLAFEVSENQTEKVYIPKGNYDMAQMEIFIENIGEKIKESVDCFYGVRQN